MGRTAIEKIITFENLRSFAYCNHAICKTPICGIVVEFLGLGRAGMYGKEEDAEYGRRLAEVGILYLIPYQNPWAWMNRQTVSLTDELIDILLDTFGLPETIPVVSTGRSMGGQSALVYTAYAKRTPVACVANCPVCDLPYHFTERPDLPRTLYSAFGTYEGTLQQALESASPLHLVEKMPDADYVIFQGEEDLAVNKQKHSDRFVEAMEKTHNISYYPIPGKGHCELGEEMSKCYDQCILNAVFGVNT